jgi:hypothetical protein
MPKTMRCFNAIDFETLLQNMLFYDDAVNLLGYNTDTIKKKEGTLINGSKDVGLEV